MRVRREPRVASVEGPNPVLIRQEDAGQPARKFLGDLLKRQHFSRTDRTFDLKLVAVKVMVALQSLDDQIVDRKPNRTAPIRVSAEQVARAFAGHILNAMLLVARVENVRALAVEARY